MRTLILICAPGVVTFFTLALYGWLVRDKNCYPSIWELLR